jgi:hypothetical protein
VGLPSDAGVNAGDRPDTHKDNDEYPEGDGDEEIKPDGEPGHEDGQGYGYSINSARGTDGHRKVCPPQEIKGITRQSTDKVEEEEAPPADESLEEFTEEEEGNHVAENVPERCVNKHGSEERPWTVSKVVWDKAEVIDKTVAADFEVGPPGEYRIGGDKRAKVEDNIGDDNGHDGIETEVELSPGRAAGRGRRAHVISIVYRHRGNS